MSTDTADHEVLLAPVTDEFPAGSDLRYTGEYDKIKGARKLAYDRQQGLAASGDPDDNLSPEDRAIAARPLWAAVMALASETLTAKSKDIQIAVWLLEANAYVNGFTGAASSLELIRSLMNRYWDTLFPPIDPEDDEPLALRVGVLDSINQRLPVILAGLPLTPNSRKYSLAAYQLAVKARQDKNSDDLVNAGKILPDQFTAAMKASKLEFLQALSGQVETCAARVTELEQLTDQRFPGQGLSFGAVRSTLEEIQFHVGRALREKTPVPQSIPTDGTRGETGSPGWPEAGSEVWQRALALVSQGQLEGFRLAQAHIESAPSGRERFLRQLQLSELCLQAGMHAFAYPILDELGQTVDERRLHTWEDPSVIRRTWAGLSTACELLEKFRPDSAQRRSVAQQRLGDLGGDVPAPPDKSEPVEQ